MQWEQHYRAMRRCDTSELMCSAVGTWEGDTKRGLERGKCKNEKDWEREEVFICLQQQFSKSAIELPIFKDNFQKML